MYSSAWPITSHGIRLSAHLFLPAPVGPPTSAPEMNKASLHSPPTASSTQFHYQSCWQHHKLHPKCQTQLQRLSTMSLTVRSGDAPAEKELGRLGQGSFTMMNNLPLHVHYQGQILTQKNTSCFTAPARYRLYLDRHHPQIPPASSGTVHTSLATAFTWYSGQRGK